MWAVKIILLTDAQRNILNRIADGTHTPLHFKTRSKIILMAGDKARNFVIAEKLSISVRAVEKWRGRFLGAAGLLAAAEAAGPAALNEAIRNALSDSPRSGRKPRITDEQEARIIALSLEDPKGLGLPFSHWSSELLRQECIKRGIVDTISCSQIRRYLKKKILIPTDSKGGSIRASKTKRNSRP
jgi:putative transposase